MFYLSELHLSNGRSLCLVLIKLECAYFTHRFYATPLCVFQRAQISYQSHRWHSAFLCQTSLHFPRIQPIFGGPDRQKLWSKARRVRLQSGADTVEGEWAPQTSLLCSKVSCCSSCCALCAWSFGIFHIFGISALLLCWFRLLCVSQEDLSSFSSSNFVVVFLNNRLVPSLEFVEVLRASMLTD